MSPSNDTYAALQCSTFAGDQTSCQATTGCTWDTASCSAYNNSQGTCTSVSGCSYPGNAGQCSAFSNESACSMQAGCGSSSENCTWNGSSCTGGSGCSVIENGDTCTVTAYWSGCTGTYDDGTCAGNYNPGTCSGSYPNQCSSFSSAENKTNCQNTIGCTWDTANCNIYDYFQGPCEGQSGCTFTEYSLCTGSFDLNTCSGTYTSAYISQITSNIPDGSYKAGQVIDIDVTFSEAVTSTGDVTVTLETGATDRTCTFTITSVTFGTCNYTVQSGDSSSDLDVISVTGIIKDAANTTLPSPVTISSYLATSEAIVIDTTAPSAPGTPDMTALADTGSSSIDNTTSSTSPAFVTTCETGATVNIKNGSTFGTLGTSTCVASRATTTTSTLSDGTYSILATQTDVAGNISASSSALSITVDATAPTTSGAPNMTSGTDSGSSSTDDITSDSTPTFTGSCTNGNTVQLYDDGTASGSTTVCASSVFSLTTGTLATGANSITFKETDTAGNSSSASDALSVTIDTTSPTISEVTPITTSTTDTTPDYIFNTNEAGSITYGGSCSSLTSSASSGSNTITLVSLTDGTYADCTIIITDTAGNLSNTLTITSFTVNTVVATPASSGGNSSGSSSRNTTPPTIPSTPNQTSISSLKQTLLSLIQQLKTLLTNQNQPIPPSITTLENSLSNRNTTPNILPTFPSSPLEYGMINEDVRSLQKFLNTHGFFVAPRGIGSLGQETNKFASATFNALKKFQASVGLPATGYFGERTIGEVRKILGR